MGYQGWDEILMITLIFSKKLWVYKIMRNTVILMSQKVNFALFIEIVFMSSGIFQVVIRQEIIR